MNSSSISMAVVMKVISAIILMLSLSVSYGQVPSIEMYVPPLQPQELKISSIEEFNSNILVRVNRWEQKNNTETYPYWKLNKKLKKLEPYLESNQKVVATFSNQDKSLQLYVTQRGNAAFLNFVDNPKRNQTVRVDAGKSFRVVANEKYSYLIFEDKIILVEPKGVEIITFDMIDIRGGFLSAVYFNNKELYLGFNRGEWGGALYALNIKSNGRFSKNISLLAANINGITADSKGKMWFSSGLAHMGLRRFGLYSYHFGKLETVLEGKGVVNKMLSESGIKLPKLTTIDALTITSEDEVLLIAAALGLITINDEKHISYLWKGELDRFYDNPEPNVSTSMSPSGVIQTSSSIFLAMRRLGVIEFERQESGHYEPTTQYTFKLEDGL